MKVKQKDFCVQVRFKKAKNCVTLENIKKTANFHLPLIKEADYQ